jgi:tetratricopeptide (TPR) repeat protein
LAILLRDIAKLVPKDFLLLMRTISGEDRGAYERAKGGPPWPAELDAAVEMILSGEQDQAKKNLEALIPSLGQNYYLYANLAVACELLGEDAAALAHVEKALFIWPNAHQNTEWMHKRVLQAKLAIAKDSSWLTSHTISGIPQGSIPMDFSVWTVEGTKNLEALSRGLAAHLVPRLVFGKKGQKDPVVATLLLEFARIEARISLVESALPVLDLAEEYGADVAALRTEWKALVNDRLESERRRPLLIILGLTLALCLGVYGYRKHRKRRNGPSPVPL